MPAKRKPAEVVAVVTFYTPDPDDGDRERRVEEGERLPADHSIVEGHRELFDSA
jgi:hypothetical protein